MKKAERIMNKALKLVKDEHKEMVEASIKKATQDFLAMSADEQEEWFDGDGTIGYFFDSNHLGFLEDYEEGMHKILLNPEVEDNEYDFVDLITEYLDCFLD